MNTAAGCDRAWPRRKLVPRLRDQRVECRHTIRTPMPVGVDHHPIKGGMSAPDTGDEAMRRQTEPERQLAPPCAYLFQIGGGCFFPSGDCRALVPLLGFGVPVETRRKHRYAGAGKGERCRKIGHLDLRHGRAADVRNGALLLHLYDRLYWWRRLLLLDGDDRCRRR